MGEPHVSSRSRIVLTILVLGLCLDITLLAVFSAMFAASQGRVHKIYLAALIITGCLIFLLIFCIKKALGFKIKELLKFAASSHHAKACELAVDTEFLASLSGLPTRFSFQDLESATCGFSTKLGRGGFGSVYLGSLADGSEIAVKRLEKGTSGQKEFCAEVATISRVRHANLICMKGFCVEGDERLLVYEHMPQGSLDRWIFHDDLPTTESGFVVLNWDVRYRIAIETARGLAYLHEECDEAILHLDVKPQNVLLDERFRAKVSDFGLSRSMDRADSRIVTTMRGTPGYLAPEWLLGGGIDVKTDVYGYGMLVLELVSGRRSVDQSQDIENWFLPAMAFRKLKENNAVGVVDPLLEGKLDDPMCEMQVFTIIQVALWCIQEDASKRPSMSSVVQMLEGKMKVTEPPLSHRFLATKPLTNYPLTSISVIDDASLLFPR